MSAKWQKRKSSLSDPSKHCAPCCEETSINTPPCAAAHQGPEPVVGTVDSTVPTSRRFARRVFRLRVVRRQIYCRIGLDEAFDRVSTLRRKYPHLGWRLDPAGKHQAVIVRSITTEKERCVVLLNQDGDMICSMTARGNCNYVSVRG